MMANRVVGIAALAALLASCGGDGGGSGGAGVPTASAPTPTPTTAAGCTLAARQRWVFDRMTEWYLFPDLLPVAFAPGAPAAGQSDLAALQDYVDQLTATARSQDKDRYFTHIASVAEESAYYDSGATAGFGVRLSYDVPARRVFVTEAFEEAPAFAAGIDRGAELLAIGTSAADLRPVADLIADGGAAAVSDALGPATAGTTRILRIADATGTRDLSVAKADYALRPISTRYGYRIIPQPQGPVGYVNLRTFISTADAGLREAFGAFRAQGVRQVIVDLRYNGGGLLSTADLFADLLGGGRTGQVQGITKYRASKAANDRVRYFRDEASAIPATKIAFIGTEGTASASEYVINVFPPYLRADAALVGTNTFGKPVGQIAFDNPACPDDRLRVTALALTNAAGTGDYYNGLAARMDTTCQAGDDLARPLGDPAEASVAAALDFLAGRGCTPIGASAASARMAYGRAREPLPATDPNVAQRETPGLF